MILPDINLLLYAYNPHSPHHDRAFDWWREALAGEELIGIPHEVSLGFVRIATNPRLGAAAVNLAKARKTVLGWTGLSHVRLLEPKSNHLERVLELTQKAAGSGALVSDAILAAHAIANRATLFSNDDDFSKFPGLMWQNPLVESV